MNSNPCRPGGMNPELENSIFDPLANQRLCFGPDNVPRHQNISYDADPSGPNTTSFRQCLRPSYFGHTRFEGRKGDYLLPCERKGALAAKFKGCTRGRLAGLRTGGECEAFNPLQGRWAALDILLKSSTLHLGLLARDAGGSSNRCHRRQRE